MQKKSTATGAGGGGAAGKSSSVPPRARISYGTVPGRMSTGETTPTRPQTPVVADEDDGHARETGSSLEHQAAEEDLFDSTTTGPALASSPQEPLEHLPGRAPPAGDRLNALKRGRGTFPQSNSPTTAIDFASTNTTSPSRSRELAEGRAATATALGDDYRPPSARSPLIQEDSQLSLQEAAGLPQMSQPVAIQDFGHEPAAQRGRPRNGRHQSSDDFTGSFTVDMSRLSCAPSPERMSTFEENEIPSSPGPSSSQGGAQRNNKKVAIDGRGFNMPFYTSEGPRLSPPDSRPRRKSQVLSSKNNRRQDGQDDDDTEDQPARRHKRKTLARTRSGDFFPSTLWTPGAEPGVDVRNMSFDLQARCEITVVDYNEELARFVHLSNETLPRFLTKQRPAYSKVRWISVEGLSWDVIKEIAMKYDLHPLPIEDLLHFQQRTKVDYYKDQVFIALMLHSLREEQNIDDSESAQPEEGEGAFKAALKRLGWGGQEASSSSSSGSSANSSDEDENSGRPSDRKRRISTGERQPLLSDARSPTHDVGLGAGSPEHKRGRVRRTATASTHGSVISMDGNDSSLVNQLPSMQGHRSPRPSFAQHFPGPGIGSPAINGIGSAFSSEPNSRNQPDVDRKARTPDKRASMLARYYPESSKFLEAHALLRQNKVDVMVEQVGCFLMKNDGVFITFFQHISPSIIPPLLSRLRARHTLLRTSADVSLMMQAVLDAVVDNALPITESYRAQIAELEATVLMRPTTEFTRELHIIQGELMLLKRTLAPMQTMIYALRDHDESRSGITPLAKTYLGDVLDHCAVIIENLEMMSSICDSLINLIFNTLTTESNSSMKRLAVMTIIFAPLSLMTSYFGMNFETFPEIKKSVLYFWALAIPIVLVVTLIFSWNWITTQFTTVKIRFKRRNAVPDEHGHTSLMRRKATNQLPNHRL